MNMQNLRNKIIAGGAVLTLAAIGTVMNRQAAQAQGGPTITIGGPIPLPVKGTVATTQSGAWNVSLTGAPSVNVSNQPTVTVGNTVPVQVTNPASSVLINNTPAAAVPVKDQYDPALQTLWSVFQQQQTTNSSVEVEFPTPRASEWWSSMSRRFAMNRPPQRT